MEIYKVLVVDDDENIVQGISALVDWKKCHAELIGKAYHGQRAYEMIQENPPDIVLTDVKMPELNGIQLIGKVLKDHPSMKFIILSGYDEFEFAKTAMAYGVKHYLLKPTNRKNIEDALVEVIEEIEAEREKEQFILKVRKRLKAVIPIAKKRFLTELILNKNYDGHKKFEQFQQLFHLQSFNERIRLLLLDIDESHHYEQLFALEEMVIEELVKTEGTSYLSTTVGNKIVFIIANLSLADLIRQMKNVQKTFHKYYHLEFTTAISRKGTLFDIKKLYEEATHSLTQRFYLGNGSIITAKDMKKYQQSVMEHFFQKDELIFSLQSGDQKKVNSFLERFFQHLQREALPVDDVKSHCLELFLVMMRHNQIEGLDSLFEQIVRFQSFQTFEEIQTYIYRLAAKITENYYKETRLIQHQIIERVIQYIQKNLRNENLTLTHVADQVVFMNSDYLGRLFKKETGETFSSYLTKQRIKKAIQLMQDHETMKIFEIANRVGFGHNPRYFGQVFKKHTGMTPSEYRREQLKS